MSERTRHYCGVFGIFGHDQAVALSYLALYGQQHRGQESAGICTTGPNGFLRHTGLGLVTEVFTEPMLQSLANPRAIGHVRYSTTGSNQDNNAQPLLANYAGGQMAVAHNGNLINAAELRRQCSRQGAVFTTSSDTEVILHLLAAPESLKPDGTIAEILAPLKGAYSLVILFEDRLVAARDPHGFRPLVLGKMANGAPVVASETCAFDMIDAEFVREIAPGEVLVMTDKGMQSQWITPPGQIKPACCVFEQIYLADPSSDVFGENVHLVRQNLGRTLARESPVEADAVIPIPNCARCAALGYAKESGLPFERGFTTSHYMGRSFIMPAQNLRDLAVKMKLKVIRSVVEGKRLVVVEDSVVRGTTTKGKIGALRKAGAREIHLRVASPPVRYPCYFGIDFPTADELVAPGRSIEEIRDYLGVDSLYFLSLGGMLNCTLHPADHYCTACFTNRYPIPIDPSASKLAFE